MGSRNTIWQFPMHFINIRFKTMKSEELYYVTFEVKKLPCNKLGPGYYKFGKYVFLYIFIWIDSKPIVWDSSVVFTAYLD